MQARGLETREKQLVKKVLQPGEASDDFIVRNGVWILAALDFAANGDPKYLSFPWKEQDEDPFCGERREEADPNIHIELQPVVPGSSCFISGGIEEEESSEEAARREFLEEQGFSLDGIPLTRIPLKKPTITVQRKWRRPSSGGLKKCLIYGADVFSFHMSHNMHEQLRRRYKQTGVQSIWLEPLTVAQLLERDNSLVDPKVKNRQPSLFWRVMLSLHEKGLLRRAYTTLLNKPSWSVEYDDDLGNLVQNHDPQRYVTPFRPSTRSLLLGLRNN